MGLDFFVFHGNLFYTFSNFNNAMDQIEMEHITFPNDISERILRMVINLPGPAYICSLPRNKKMETYLYEHKTVSNDELHKLGLNEIWKKTAGVRIDKLCAVKYILTAYTLNNEAVFVTKMNENFEKIPSNYYCPFYNGMTIPISEYIIFTDNIFWACSILGNDYYRNPPIISPLLEDDQLDKLDFSVFEKKKIFYVLFTHSGKNWRETCFTAERIAAKFPKTSEVSFISLPFCFSGIARELQPIFISTYDQFKKELEHLNTTPDTNDILSVFWRIPNSPARKEITNDLWERTITFMYGCSRSDSTMYLVNMAAALSQGKPHIQNYPVQKPIKVAYIYVGTETEEVKREIPNAFKKLLDISLPPLQDSIATDYAVDASCFIAADNMFNIYPGIIVPFKKFQSDNFYYSIFFPEKTLTENIGDSIKIILVKMVQALNGNVQMLVLDLPSWCSDLLCETTDWLYDLRSQYTVVISCNNLSPKKVSKIHNLPNDRIIRMQRNPCQPDSISLDLHVERDDIKRKNKTIKLIKAYADQQWKMRTVKTSTSEKLQYIKKYQNKTIKNIALALGISESYVKKLRREAGIAKEIPARGNRNFKKPSLYSL